MTLRKRILFYIAVATLTVLVVLYLSSRSIMLGNYTALEQKSTAENMKRVLYTLSEDVRMLRSLGTNYSAWNDTYYFVQDGQTDDILNHPYVKSNYSYKTFSLNQLNLIVLLDQQGNVIYGELLDLQSKTLGPIPEEFKQHIDSKTDYMLQHNNLVGDKTGVLMLKDNPMLVASLPVVTSDMLGPIKGTMVFGRYFDTKQLKDVATITGSHLTFAPFQGEQPPVPIKQSFPSWTTIAKTPIQVKVQNEQLITGSALIHDIYGKPAFVLKSHTPRDVYNRGKTSLVYMLGAMLLAGLACTASILYFLEHSLLSRLTLLMNSVSKISKYRDFSARVEVTGADEVGKLETEINQMMSALEESQMTITYQAYHDALTGLPNRYLFFEYLENAIQTAKDNGHESAIIFIDLDNFKSINDTLGHDMGDLLLCESANRLRECIRPGDIVSRLGGDEFILLLSTIHDHSEIDNVASAIVQTLSLPFELDDNQMFVSASIGISLFPHDGNDAMTLLKNADTAMFRVKKEGKNNYRFFTEEMKDNLSRKLLIEQYLRKALEYDELTIHYQPKVAIQTGQIVGMEALVRWEHPILGIISPVEFIPVAEDTGLILPIGEWVLRTACKQNRIWQKGGYPHLRVAVNLSSIQFQDEQLVEKIRHILAETTLDSADLELEITESIAIKNAEQVVHKLHELKQIGIKISIDDFGTGYSSLSYLKKFPIDTLKIDKAFIDDITVNVSIPRAIIAMAQSLHLHVTAEGVETSEQMSILHELGCDDMQGYFYSKPLPAEAFEQLLKRKPLIRM